MQQLYPARLWVSLLDTASEGTLTLDNLPLLLGESMTELESAGMTENADVFLAAHGHPGKYGNRVVICLYVCWNLSR